MNRGRFLPFGAAGFALFVLLVGSNLPTPLFPVYAKAYGLSPLGVTLLFATYTLLVIPALLVFGPLSDVKGRREVLIGAIVVAAIAAGLFGAAHTVVVLFVAQAVQAMALGALQGTAAPTLIEQDPSDRTRRASAIASALTVAGAAAGPLLAGGLAQYALLPQRLAYLVEIALLGFALLAVVMFLPRRRRRAPWRPRRPTVPAEIRRPFIVAGISAFVAWAVTGLFLSLIPSFVTSELGHDNLLLAGGVVALMLGPAAVVQLAGQRLESLRAQVVGLVVMLAGVSALLVSDASRSLALLIIAAVLAGLGQGLSFMGSLGDVGEIAPEERKGDIVASYYVVVYVGTALPAIGVGAVAQASGLPTAVEIFATIVILICLAGIAGLIAETRQRSNATHDALPASRAGYRNTMGQSTRKLQPVHLVRYGLPTLICLAGIIVLAVGSGAAATGAGVVLIGVAAIVLLVNALARLTISSQEDRARERRVLDTFSQHGRWPQDQPPARGPRATVSRRQ